MSRLYNISTCREALAQRMRSLQHSCIYNWREGCTSCMLLLFIDFDVCPLSTYTITSNKPMVFASCVVNNSANIIETQFCLNSTNCDVLPPIEPNVCTYISMLNIWIEKVSGLIADDRHIKFYIYNRSIVTNNTQVKCMAQRISTDGVRTNLGTQVVVFDVLGMLKIYRHLNHMHAIYIIMSCISVRYSTTYTFWDTSMLYMLSMHLV